MTLFFERIKIRNCGREKEQRIIAWLKENVSSKKYWYDWYSEFTNMSDTFIIAFYDRDACIQFKLIEF
jgi:hypothetical protein